MNKRVALEILITHSFFLAEETKKQLLSKLPELSDNEVDKIGKLLALEKKEALKFAKEFVELDSSSQEQKKTKRRNTE